MTCYPSTYTRVDGAATPAFRNALGAGFDPARRQHGFEPGDATHYTVVAEGPTLTLAWVGEDVNDYGGVGLADGRRFYWGSCAEDSKAASAGHSRAVCQFLVELVYYGCAKEPACLADRRKRGNTEE